MRLFCQLIMLSCLITANTHAQDDQMVTLNIGDSAPPLRVRTWLKGTPVQQFEKGMVYVIEFWATWCAPCRSAMPHLSALANQYKGKVTIIGMDIKETQMTSIQTVKAFVDSMGSRMDYVVAVDDSNSMVTSWLDATGENNNGIPKSFVVNGDGRLAWIGHPKDLHKVLPEIVNNNWNLKVALANRNQNKYLESLDDSLSFELFRYGGDPDNPNDLGKPDSVLLIINEMVRKEPKLKFAPTIAFYTFFSLLKTDPHKAYEYGKTALVTPSFDDPPFARIYSAILLLSVKKILPDKIYHLGAEAYQAEINQFPYPELLNLPNRYSKMAEWYWRANDPSKAVEAQQKALEAMKIKHDSEIAAFELRLQQYKNIKQAF